MAHLRSVEVVLPAGSERVRTPIESGTVLAGRYVIQSRIGEGGMGHVFRAWHRDLDIPVAIKLVRPELAGDAEMLARFLDEARSMASIRSEAIVGVYDVARLPDGTPYLVLELVDGPDLDQFLVQHRPLSSADAIGFALDVCAGLKVAHANGIVHRDIKPENLLVATKADGAKQLKISDFGIAKRVALSRSRIVARPTETVGSPLYMAPEQMQGAVDVDGRADLWSLGIVLYEMVTGQLPFNGTTPEEVATQVFSCRAGSPRLHRSTIPTGLERVIARCLEREPDDRYQSVDELAGDLARVSVPFGVESRRLGDFEIQIDDDDSAIAEPVKDLVTTRRVASLTPPPLPSPKRPVLRLDLEPESVRLPRPAEPVPNRWGPRLIAALAIALVIVGFVSDDSPFGSMTREPTRIPTQPATGTPSSAPGVGPATAPPDGDPVRIERSFPADETHDVAPASALDAGSHEASRGRSYGNPRAGEQAETPDVLVVPAPSVGAESAAATDTVPAMPTPANDTVVPEATVLPDSSESVHPAAPHVADTTASMTAPVASEDAAIAR